MCPAIVEEGHQRGYIIPIGGAENKDTNPSILKKFTEISGGTNAKIVIIPTASRLDDTGERYEKIFTDIGVGEVSHIDITSREDCNNPEFASRCEEATGIFITGGNQLRLATILGGTAVAQVIRTANARGVHVAGTSAGASIMSEHMIAGGESNESPREGGAILAPGLGLTNAMIIDQHFSERNRLGRLLSAIAFNPFLMGVGIDEDTAAFIGPDDMCEVVGSGTVTIVDGGDLTYSSAYGTDNTKALGLLGLKLDILHEGCLYNFDIREAFPPIEDRQNVCKI
ncbi:MAG: cyanophycinase [Emcibacteraceae bacterium]